MHDLPTALPRPGSNGVSAQLNGGRVMQSYQGSRLGLPAVKKPTELEKNH